MNFLVVFVSNSIYKRFLTESFFRVVDTIPKGSVRLFQSGVDSCQLVVNQQNTCNMNLELGTVDLTYEVQDR